jgi:hypothetical protein
MYQNAKKIIHPQNRLNTGTQMWPSLRPDTGLHFGTLAAEMSCKCPIVAVVLVVERTAAPLLL